MGFIGFSGSSPCLTFRYQELSSPGTKVP